MRATAGGDGVILEAFKPGTGAADTYSIIGYEDSIGAPARRLAAGQPRRRGGHRRPVLSGVARRLARCAARLYDRPRRHWSAPIPRIGDAEPMRAETETLVDEIKQAIAC